MSNHVVTASDQVWPSRLSYFRGKNRFKMWLCPWMCRDGAAAPQHLWGASLWASTHTSCKEQVSEGKEFISGCSRGWKKKKSLEVFLHCGTSQLLSRHYFPLLQLELSHKKSLTPERDGIPNRILKLKSSHEIQPQQTFDINGHKSLISLGMCLHCLPHHGGALGITSCR